MSSAHTRRVRAAAVVATTLAVGGLSLAAAPAANAVVLDPMSISGTELEFDDDPAPGGTCTFVGPADQTSETQVLADGLPRTTTVAGSASSTRDADPGDVSTVNATASRTITASQAGGQLSRISVKDTFSASTTSTRGAAQQCNLGATGMGNAQLAFDLVRPTYVTVTAKARGVLAQAFVAKEFPGGGGENPDITGAIAGGKNGNGEGRALLQPGTFYIGFSMSQAGVTAPQSLSGEATVEITFGTPGEATSAATGKGKKYATLPAAYDCATGTAAVTWTKKAGKKKASKVKKAKFKVGALTVGKAKKPTKGKTTTLKGLPGSDAFTLTGTIKLKSGKTVTVSRDYQACS